MFNSYIKKIMTTLMLFSAMSSMAIAELTSSGNTYIATNFGTNNCFVATGLSWSYLGIDGITYYQTGATAQIVSNFVMNTIVQSVTINGITYTYSMLKSNNGDKDITLNDALWIAQHDGSPSGESQYCSGPTPPVPEVSTIMMVSIGILGMLYIGHRKK